MSGRVFWSTFEEEPDMFLRSSLFSRFHGDFCWIDDEIAEFDACMHSFASQETSSAESFQGDNKSHTTCMYPPCCGVKRVADTFVEVSLVLGFFVAG